MKLVIIGGVAGGASAAAPADIIVLERGAVNIPVDELRGRISEVPHGREAVAYGQVGQRGYIATRLLLQAGRRVSNLGGYRTYAHVRRRQR